MFFHYTYFNETRAGAGVRRLVSCSRRRARKGNDIGQQIDAAFANSAFETAASTENAFVRAIAEQIGDVGAIVIAILGPVLFTILLVCGNTMAQAVRERTNELAVLETLGFTEERVLALVLTESFVLPLVAGAVGLTVWLLIARANPTGGTVPMSPLSPFEIALGELVALLVGLTSAVVPAWQVRRMTIVDALRRAR